VNNKIIFVSGIDTDIGKTIATGWLAKKWRDNGINTITQKLVQTGSCGLSADIKIHRQIMGTGLLPVDYQGLSCTAHYRAAVSPHLAASLEAKPLDLAQIEKATAYLCTHYQQVLIEGAGGLMVPLNNELLTIEYIARQKWPVILVTSARLGSINHSLLSLLALVHYGVPLHAIAWNSRDDALNPIITADSRDFIRTRTLAMFPQARWYDIPILTSDLLKS